MLLIHKTCIGDERSLFDRIGFVLCLVLVASFCFFVGRFCTLTQMSISIQMIIYSAGFDIEITLLSIDRLVLWPSVLRK